MIKIESKLAEAVGKKENYSLEDVLVAWDKKLISFWGYGLKRNGMNEVLNNIILSWTPNKPFHLQSQETKDFIGDLLLTK